MLQMPCCYRREAATTPPQWSYHFRTLRMHIIKRQIITNVGKGWKTGIFYFVGKNIKWHNCCWINSVQSLSRVQLFVTPWTAAHQASLSITSSRSLLLNTFWQFVNKLNINLPYDPAIPLIVIYPREIKIHIQTKNWAWMFIAALFSVSQRSHQLMNR